MKRWLSEPLLHFLVAGGLLFAAYAWLNRNETTATDAVRITTAEVNWLKETWARQWRRPPDEQELRGLVIGYLKEELMAREAKEIGLDQNDTIVRRRLAQKMEFIVQDTARLAEPDEAQLRQRHEANRERYKNPTQITLTQIFFKTEAAAQKGLAALKRRPADEIGDPSMLERVFLQADLKLLSSQFGADFAGKAFALEPDRWQGPLASAYGFHLVRVSEKQESGLRPFEEVRAQVLEEWHIEQLARTNEQYFAGLLKKYRVDVEDSLKPLLGSLLPEKK